MATNNISIDWDTKTIFVPKSYTQFVSNELFEIRQLDVNNFRLDLKSIESSIEGVVNERTHIHNTTVTVGGVTLARVVIMINGYTVTFEDGNYAVNLVGANTNIADVTNLNNVQIRSSNSAGLTFNEEINNQSYIGAQVYIDTAGLGLAGTQFPRGTPTSPVNNWLDALFIATARNFRNYHLSGFLIFTGQTSQITQTNWVGASPISTFITSSNVPLSINRSTFTRVALNGEYTGPASFIECNLGGVTIPNSNPNFIGFQGLAKESAISGDIILDSGTLEACSFLNCFSNVPNGSKPTIDCGLITNTEVAIRNYTGDLRIKNLSDGNTVIIEMTSGVIDLDPSCTGGTIETQGIAELINNVSSGCTVNTTGLIDAEAVNALSFSNNELFIDTQNGKEGTQFPLGTSKHPVNNIEDALIIANNFRLRGIRVRGSLVIQGKDVSGLAFVGDEIDSIIIFAPNTGNKTDNCTFINIIVSGQLQGHCFGDKIAIHELHNIGSNDFPSVFSGAFIRADVNTDAISFNPNLTTPQDVHFIDCQSMALDNEVLTLNKNSSGTPIAFRRFNGSMLIKNKTDNVIDEIQFNQGKLNVDPTCTGGTLNLSGIYRLENNGTSTIIEDNTSITDNINFSSANLSADTSSIASAVWNKLTSDHETSSTFGRLLNDLLTASGQIQQSSNLNTELLKNKPNNK